MEIRALNPHDEAEFNRFHAVIEAAERFERPLAAVWSLEEARIDFTDEDPGERVCGVVAVEGEDVVGAGVAFLSTMDNLHLYATVDLKRQGADYVNALTDAQRAPFVSVPAVPPARRAARAALVVDRPGSRQKAERG